MGEHWYRMQGIDVTDTDRGGRVTYHGPGQLVGYPIVSLRPYGDDVHAYVRRMEQVMIRSLAEHGVEAGLIEDLTGVWVRAAAASDEVADPAAEPAAPVASQPGDTGRAAEDVAGGVLRKIGSIGVHVNRSITTHGFAVNVSNDLQPFEWIVPCGIETCRMTSLTRELGAEQDLGAFATTVAERFGEVYGRQPVEVAAERLAELVDGVGALAGGEAAQVR